MNPTTRTTLRRLARSALAAAAVASTSANALPISVSSGSSVTFDFNGFYNTSPQIVIPGLQSSVTLSAFDFVLNDLAGTANDRTSVSFNYSLSNTSTNPVLTSRVSVLGFNTSPTILSSGNVVTGIFGTVASGNMPNGIGQVELCLTNVNCSGGGGGGVTLGNTGIGTATLSFAGLLSSLTFDGAWVRYQSVSCAQGSPCSGSASGIGRDRPPTSVPEPGALALLALGLAGGALSLRNRRRALAS